MENEPRAYLMMKDGEIINRVLWDGDTETWQPPEGVEMVPESSVTPPPEV